MSRKMLVSYAEGRLTTFAANALTYGGVAVVVFALLLFLLARVRIEGLVLDEDANVFIVRIPDLVGYARCEMVFREEDRGLREALGECGVLKKGRSDPRRFVFISMAKYKIFGGPERSYLDAGAQYADLTKMIHDGADCGTLSRKFNQLLELHEFISADLIAAVNRLLQEESESVLYKKPAADFPGLNL